MIETKHVWDTFCSQKLLNHFIALVLIGKVEEKASYRPVFQARSQPVYAGEHSRDRFRQAQRRQLRLSALKLEIGKTRSRILQGFVVVLRSRPADYLSLGNFSGLFLLPCVL